MAEAVFRTLWQPTDSLQAPAVRAVQLQESWPAGEVEDGERRGRRLREQARQKGSGLGLGKSGERKEEGSSLFLYL
ncbi:hypothetical protein EPR50_G00207260 [Perca flavescens]|uniref:Uncharacterized protein n=1 Tax=Perca flavescens TaxID=8167 RepID=A0A484C5T9_PERFV|nr:hypothetical protein EPR50_G00207260 [Perca flavescens]